MTPIPLFFQKVNPMLYIRNKYKYIYYLLFYKYKYIRKVWLHTTRSILSVKNNRSREFREICVKKYDVFNAFLYAIQVR